MVSRPQCILAFTLLVIAADGASAVSGVEGTFEYSFDVPWRIEPSVTPDGGIEFGAIPIHFSLHDGDLDAFTATDELLVYEPICDIQFGRLSGQTVRVDTRLGFACGGFITTDYGNATVHTLFDFADLAEIEATVERWPAPGMAPSPSVAFTATAEDGCDATVHIRWTVEASDEAGNTTRTPCEVLVVRP
jgi:hypothetical protein